MCVCVCVARVAWKTSLTPRFQSSRQLASPSPCPPRVRSACISYAEKKTEKTHCQRCRVGKSHVLQSQSMELAGTCACHSLTRSGDWHRTGNWHRTAEQCKTHPNCGGSVVSAWIWPWRSCSPSLLTSKSSAAGVMLQFTPPHARRHMRHVARTFPRQLASGHVSRSCA